MSSLNNKIGQFIAVSALVCANFVYAETNLDERVEKLEEVVVTAQRREQRLQDVPISVTALSADLLADNGVRNLEDLSGIAPSLYTTNSVNYGFTTMICTLVG